MDKLKQVIEQIKEYEDNNCFELKTSIVLHWLNEIQKEAFNYTHSCESDSELLAEHKCKFYVNADWSYLKCGCGKRIKPSEG